jgi:predicted nucleotidyltransferase component of viral defense system
MLHLTTVEKTTYTLLQQLFEINFIREKFALAGGTSLALQIGHRKSIDLDLFSPSEFNVKELEIILTSAPNIQFNYAGSNSRMLFCYINHIKCDFVNEPASLIEPFGNDNSFLYYSIKDIAAMKMHTVCGRGKKKDFFDIYSLLQLYDWQTMLSWFEKKYSANQLYFLWRSISYFTDAEDDPEIQGLAPFTKNWEEIKEFILKTCI